MPTRYLSAEAILVIHARIIEKTGGAHGIRESGMLASIVEKPQASFGGQELYPGIFLQAAVYLEAIANYHVFIDGNKRTAIGSSARFLFDNGYELKITNKEVEQFVIKVVVDKLDLDIIAGWLESHSVKID